MMRDILEEYVFADDEYKKNISVKNLAEENPYLFEDKKNPIQTIDLGSGELTIIYPDKHEFLLGRVTNLSMSMKDDRIDTLSYMLGAVEKPKKTAQLSVSYGYSVDDIRMKMLLDKAIGYSKKEEEQC